MDQWTLRTAELPTFLEALRGEYRVLAPRAVDPGDVVFADFAMGVPIPFDFVNTLMPPKALFFPRRESLFGFRGTTRPAIAPREAVKPLAVFGVRSCDSSGLAFLERFFSERSFDDGAVTGRIRDSLTMTLACHSPGPDCFCVCCEGGPFLQSGFDLQFTDLGETLLAEEGSEKGAKAVRKAPGLFSPVQKEHLEAKARMVAKVDSLFQRRSYMSDGIKRVTLGRIPQEKWETWAADCQGCGGCCFVCPTCSCFTVRDAWRGPEAFSRERSWDACLYSGFTREASGHNPRANKAERLKRRFFHKMSLQYQEMMGRHGCVGCGRCVTTCMGGLDISTLLTRIKDECP